MSPAAALLTDAPDLGAWEWPEAQLATIGSAIAAEENKPKAAAIAVVPKRTLRDHVSRVEYIADVIEAMDDEAMTAETRDELSEALIVELAGTKAKVDAVASTLAMFESLEAAAIAERERLDKRAAAYAKRAARLADYVLATLEASKLDRLDGETSSLARRLNPPAVMIDDAAKITHEFMAYPEAPPPRPDKAAIKKAIAGGRKVPGARLLRTARLVRS